MTDRLDVFVSFDEAYGYPASVTLASLEGSLRSTTRCTVHAAVSGVSQRTRELVEGSAPSLDIRWLEPDPGLLEGADVSRAPGLRYISRSTLWRLVVDALVPDDVPRVLSLDVDTLVRADPVAILGAELGPSPVGAVRDAELTEVGRAVPHWRRIGCDPDAPYFNAGVLVIDREAWRHDGIGRRALEILVENPGLLRFNEQDALNLVLAGRWQALPWRWNFQAPVSWGLGGDAAPVYAACGRDDIDRAVQEPAIVHFSGGMKPWHRGGSVLPFWDEWTACKLRTPWALEPARPMRSGSIVRAALGRVWRAGRVLATGS
jgi:lipopolysaccharide biosynthesis glycosyltransferase